MVGGPIPPRIPLTSRTNQGHHAGLIDTDLVVPVLVRGPDVGPLAAREVLGLHTLYRDLPELRSGLEPMRERHSFGVWLRLDDLEPGAELRLSPAPRRHVGLAAASDRVDLWTEYDVVATYLSRGRLALRATVRHGMLQPLARAELEVDVGEVRFTLFGTAAPTGWAVGVSAGVRLTSGIRVSWLAPDGLALGIEW